MVIHKVGGLYTSRSATLCTWRSTSPLMRFRWGPRRAGHVNSHRNWSCMNSRGIYFLGRWSQIECSVGRMSHSPSLKGQIWSTTWHAVVAAVSCGGKLLGMSGSVNLSQTRFAIDSPCSLDAPTRQRFHHTKIDISASVHLHTTIWLALMSSRRIDSIPLTFAFSFGDIAQARDQSTHFRHFIMLLCSVAATFSAQRTC